MLLQELEHGDSALSRSSYLRSLGEHSRAQRKIELLLGCLGRAERGHERGYSYQ